jgi:hypothetical protein
MNATRLAREVFSWDRAVAPLLHALEVPRGPARREIDAHFSFAEDCSLRVLEDRPLEQRFVSRVDGLCAVECWLAPCDPAPLKPVVFSLYRLAVDDPGVAVTRELVARREQNDVRGQEWTGIEFESLHDSAGDLFAFTIESRGRKEQEGVCPWAFSAQPYPLRELFYAGRSLRHQRLCLRTMAVTESS